MSYTSYAMLVAVLLMPVFATRKTPDPVQVVEEPAETKFGETITFHARLIAQEPIEEVVILISAEGDNYTETGVATLSADGQTSYEYQLGKHPLRAFSQINYRYRVKLAGGEEFTTTFLKYYYEDNRFPWQTLEEKPFRVHWYSGDIALAQNVLDVARAGLERVQSLVTVSQTEQQPVEIYIYAKAKDMQATLSPSGQNWVAGHADPDLGVMVVALPNGPDQRLLMEQRIPHELMHIMLYRLTGSGYSHLPAWLNEGLASTAELYPNPDYQVLLDSAYQENGLLPISSLCDAFPRDASNALLAYSQASSFTRFLHSVYGTSGMDDLVKSYANGLDCRRGAEASLGNNLTRLERQWRQATFSENASLTALNNLLPWLILLLAALGGPLAATFIRLRNKPVASKDYSTF